MSDDVVLLLGAGASLPLPAGSPLFRHVRDACAERAGVTVRRWADDDPKRELVDHVIPEVFLKLLSDAGYQLGDALARAVQGSPGSGPNAVHHTAAAVLRDGGTVWTTNWDTWIETAAADIGLPIKPAVYPIDPPPGQVRFGKLHGSVDRSDSLLFSTPHVMRPVAAAWHDALVASCRRHRLFVVGYAGADIDLYPAIAEAVRVARAVYWFEGAGDADPDVSDGAASAAYERWRFRLDGRHDDPGALPDTGRLLVWCGRGSTVSSPSSGLLLALGRAGDVEGVPRGDEQFAHVDRCVRGVEQRGPRAGTRLLLAALVNERLGQRWRAALRHAAVVAIGTPSERRKATRSLGNLVLLRTQPFRLAAVRAYGTLGRSPERRAFMALHAGTVDHDAETAAKVARGEEEVPVDAGLNLAMSGRWSGNLVVAERIARRQFERALAEDLSSSKRDWPERVARAAYEVAQALLWQGRYYDADDVCRSAYMRVAGAKWTAWEFAVRAVVQFAEGDYETADASFERAIGILHREGFYDFTPTLFLGRAAAHRVGGDMAGAAGYVGVVERYPRKGPGTMAALLAEQAEQARAVGRPDRAVELWTAQCASKLPLWKALAHLRLAECGGPERRRDAEVAVRLCTDIGCRWGDVRGTALLDGLDEEAIAGRARDLGPTQVFVPGNPWLF